MEEIDREYSMMITICFLLSDIVQLHLSTAQIHFPVAPDVNVPQPLLSKQVSAKTLVLENKSCLLSAGSILKPLLCICSFIDHHQHSDHGATTVTEH